MVMVDNRRDACWVIDAKISHSIDSWCGHPQRIGFLTCRKHAEWEEMARACASDSLLDLKTRLATLVRYPDDDITPVT
jgi:hypothetical protein